MAVKEILSQTEMSISKQGMVLRALTNAVAVGNLVENEYKAEHFKGYSTPLSGDSLLVLKAHCGEGTYCRILFFLAEYLNFSAYFWLKIFLRIFLDLNILRSWHYF